MGAAVFTVKKKKKKKARVLSLTCHFFGDCSRLIIYKIWAEKNSKPTEGTFFIFAILNMFKFCFVLGNHDAGDRSWYCHQRSRVQHLECLASVPKGAGACLLIPNGSHPREICEMFITNVKCKIRLADSVVNQSQSQGRSQLCHCL